MKQMIGLLMRMALMSIVPMKSKTLMPAVKITAAKAWPMVMKLSLSLIPLLVTGKWMSISGWLTSMDIRSSASL